jgi:hypothetical protein
VPTFGFAIVISKTRVRVVFQLSFVAVATSREGHRMLQSGRADQHQRWDRARARSAERNL